MGRLSNAVSGVRSEKIIAAGQPGIQVRANGYQTGIEELTDALRTFVRSDTTFPIPALPA